MTLPARALKDVGALEVRLQVSIGASRQRVWDALIHDTSRWWPKDFYATSNPKTIIIEPHPGGRMYEDAGNGAGLLWYTVIAIEPPSSIHFAGHITPPFGGPATSLLRLSLEETSARSVTLHISDSLFGCINDRSGESIQDGWRILFEDGLKGYVERVADAIWPQLSFGVSVPQAG
jgi:uncharacterized protein YndB with AHSA1/START domain